MNAEELLIIESLIGRDPSTIKVAIISIMMLSPAWGMFLFGYFLYRLERYRDEKRKAFWKGYTYAERKEAYQHLNDIGLQVKERNKDGLHNLPESIYCN